MTGPSDAQTVGRLLTAGPEPGNDDGWGAAVLSAAMRLTGEHAPLVRESAARVRELAGARGWLTAWADLLAGFNEVPRDLSAMLAAGRQLAALRAADLAVFALHAVARQARQDGRRTQGELLYLAGLAVLDRAGGARFEVAQPSDPVGADEGAAKAAAAWRHVVAGDAEALAVLLSQEAAAPGVAASSPPGPGHLAEGLLLAAQLLRSSTDHLRVDVGWLRGRLVYGLGFIVPALGAPRFAWYAAYAEAAGLPMEVLAPLHERWSARLLDLGRLPEALDVLQRVRPRATSGPAATIARGLSRAWRQAGDWDAALRESDAALAHLPSEASAVSRGNVWLNRAYGLREAGRPVDAFAAAQTALAAFQGNPRARIGVGEAEALMCACDPNPLAAVTRARELLARDETAPLPAPARTTILREAGEALAASDVTAAYHAFQAAAAAASPSTRAQVLALLGAARLAWVHREDASVSRWGGEGLARDAYRAARGQQNRWLSARAGLLLARWLGAAAETRSEAGRVGGAALADLEGVLAGLPAAAGGPLVEELRDDLLALFDTAVALGEGRMALRVAELGRAVRLTALLRFDPAQLPEEVRAALAALTAAEQARDGDAGEADEGSTQNRSAADAAYAEQAAGLEAVAGAVFRGLTADPPTPVEAVRDRFPRAHLLTLAERAGVLRWAWWAPGSAAPQVGRCQLPPDTGALLDAYCEDVASPRSAVQRPGDPVGALSGLLPEPLVGYLTGASPALSAARPVDLLIVPAGRLWQVPWPAVPVGPAGPPLVVAARLTVSPSLSLAAAVAASDRDESGPQTTTIGGYCHPHLGGARRELAALTRGWDGFQPWDGMGEVRRAFSSGRPRLTLGVVSTHGEARRGLAQAAVDHGGGRFTAGEALQATFPRVTVLPICYGLDGAPPEEEPIGLLTVAQTRGATWVVGGHQQVRDDSTGWVLARAYAAMRAGAHVTDALREAQLQYLKPDQGGPFAAEHPWSWALTVVGPPHPDAWSRDQLAPTVRGLPHPPAQEKVS